MVSQPQPRKWLGLAWLMVSIGLVQSASPGLLDPSFDPGLGADSVVHALLVQPDGRIVIGGAFTNFNGTFRRGIARLLHDGTVDQSFDPGEGIGGMASYKSGTPRIYTLALQEDSKILIGGEFTRVQGVQRLRLARLNSDGSLDTAFNPIIERIPGEDPEGNNYGVRAVHALVIQRDGRILAGGEFSAVNGVAHLCVARLNRDGSLDASFDPAGSMGLTDVVRSITLLEDGGMVLAGEFYNYGFPGWRSSQANPPLRRLSREGQRDDGFERQLRQGFGVNSVVTLPNGDLVAGGQFDEAAYYDVPPQPLVARFRPDGSLVRWHEFGGEGDVRAILAGEDGRMLIGGNFEALSGKHREGVARLLPEDLLDQCFGVGFRLGGHRDSKMANVQAMQWSAQGSGFYIVGNFKQAGGAARSGIARLQLEQKCDGGTIRFAVSELRVRQDAGTAHILVERTSSDNQAASVLFETQDGSAKASLDYTAVSERIHFSPGELYKTTQVPIRMHLRGTEDQTVQLVLRDAAGAASLGDPPRAVLRISPVTGLETVMVEHQELRLALPVTNHISLTRQPDGRWLAIGCIWQNSLPSMPTITRLKADGTIDDTFPIGFVPESCISGVEFQADNRIILWGSVAGSLTNRSYWIARLDENGSRDDSFRPPLFQPASTYLPSYDSSDPIISVSVLPDNQLIVSGRFLVIEGAVEHRGLVRLLSNGRVDSSFHAELPEIDYVAVPIIQPDGRCLVQIHQYINFNSKYELIRLNPDGSRDFGFETKGVSPLSSWPILLQPDGKILLSASAMTESTSEDPLLIRLNPDGSRDFLYQPADFRSEPWPEGYKRSVYLNRVLPMKDSSVLVLGRFDKAGGIQNQSLVRLLPNGELDVGFRAYIPPETRNGVSYSPGVADIYEVDEDHLIAQIWYTAPLSSIQPYQYWKLKEYRFVTSNSPPAFQISTVATNSVLESNGEAVVRVYRTGSAVDSARVRFHTMPGSAQEGSDFVPQSGLLEFTPGERLQEIHIPVRNDGLVEPNEVFRVRLSDPSEGTKIEGPDSVEVQILNDDHAIEFGSAEYRVGELGNVIELHVRRNGIPVAPVTVDYTTRDGTATAQADYEPFHGTLYFDSRWHTNQVIVFQIRDDALAEGEEEFQVVLSNPSGGATLGPKSSAKIKIVDNDTPNRPGRGVDGKVLALAAQQDGKVMVGGDFRTINGVVRTSLARTHADLSLDESFDARLDAETQIRRIAVQSDGKVIATGSFTNIQGIPRKWIARFQPDGALDQDFDLTFQPTKNPYGYYYDPPMVSAITVLPDDKILIGGFFTQVNGQVRVGIARLNADGLVDPAFFHGLFAGGPPETGGYVLDMITQPDGKIVIGGLGNTMRDVFHNTVVRMEADGSLDPFFMSYLWREFWEGGKMPFLVQSLVLQSSGQILVLHNPEAMRGRQGPPLSRLDPNGKEDTQFAASWPWWSGLTYPSDLLEIKGLIEAPDGALWIGGKSLLIRLTSRGILDHEIASPLSFNMEPRPVYAEYYSYGSGLIRSVRLETPEITTFALKPDGRIVIGGNFVTYAGQPVYGLLDIYADGTPADLFRLALPRVLEDGRVRLNAIVPAQETVTLEQSHDLVTWQPLVTTHTTTNRLEVIDPDPPGEAVRFYRFRRGVAQ